MAIVVHCSGCGEELRVKDSFAGRTIRCKVCKQSVLIPGAGRTLRSRGRARGPSSGLPKILGIVAGVVVLALIVLAVVRVTSPPESPRREQAAASAPAAPERASALEAPAPPPAEPAKAVTVQLKTPPSTPPGPREQRAAPSGSPISAAPAEPKPRYPNFPDAVTEPPAWLLEPPAPFDLHEYFREPPWDQNAAPLYLDALYEFYEPLEVCFTEEERKARTSIAAQRRRSVEELIKRLRDNPNSVTEEELAAVVASHDAGFKKLAEAQRRNECKFPLRLAAEEPLEARALRPVLNALLLRAELQLDRKQIEEFIETMAVVLRSARDVQKPSSTDTEAMLAAAESMIFAAQRVMYRRKLATKEPWERVLACVAEHQAGRRDWYVEVMKGDYLLWRSLLHDTAVEPQGPGEKVIARVKYRLELFRKAGIAEKHQTPEAVAEVIRGMTAADCQSEAEVLAAVVKALLQPMPFVERRRVAREQYARIDKETKLLRLVMVNLDRHHSDLQLGECAVALQLAWLTVEYFNMLHKSDPPDLEAAAKAAGLPHAPLDPFSDRPLKLTHVKGKLAVYSVGPDGIDQDGQVPFLPSTIDDSGDIRQFRPGLADD